MNLKLILWMILAVVASLHGMMLSAEASSPKESIQTLNVGGISSLKEMRVVLEQLKQSTGDAVKANRLTFEFQKVILAQSGECVGKMMTLYKTSSKETAENKQEMRELFLVNREILGQILSTNKKIIDDFRDNRLDQMADPIAFFKTPEWQQPQSLLSLSSYWMGWNGYYGSLFLPENEPLRKTMLEEGVESFSRAFVDAKQEKTAVASLFGRGLCYKQLKVYESSAKDFKSVRGVVKKDDLLYLRSLYEEAFANYRMGNEKLALNNLNTIEKEYPENKIPDEMREDLNNLKSNLVFSEVEKKGEPIGKEASSDQEIRQAFQKLRQMATHSPGLNVKVYDYVQKHISSLKDLSYDELGPVGAVSLGDGYFDQKEYDRALRYYLSIQSDSPAVLKKQMDNVWFRIAYIYYGKGEWKRALSFISSFNSRFPNSPLSKKAASLFYATAYHHYYKSRSEEAYKVFINSVQIYLERCKDCPDQGEARLQLGNYYQKKSKSDPALQEYLKVNRDSPAYWLAQYHILQLKIDQLESLRRKGLEGSPTALSIYRDGVKRVDEYRKNTFKLNEAETQKKIEPYMVILQARLNLYGPENACEENLNMLEGFEKRFPDEKDLFTEALDVKIESYLRLRKMKEAEEEASRLIQTLSKNPERYTFLKDLADRDDARADFFQNRGDAVTASQYRRIALLLYKGLYAFGEQTPSLNKQAGSIQTKIAKIYIHENNLSEAIKVYQDLQKQNPLLPETMLTLGELYEKAGRWEEASSLWERLSAGMEAGTRDWFETRYRTAAALEKLGSHEKACNLVRVTLILHPDLGDDDIKNKFNKLKSEVCQ